MKIYTLSLSVCVCEYGDMVTNKINAKGIRAAGTRPSPPVAWLPTRKLLTLFFHYWLTLLCLECSSRCRVSGIIDKPQGQDPWIRLTGLSKQPWQTLTSTSTASQVYEGKMHLGRSRRKVFCWNLSPSQTVLQLGAGRDKSRAASV